MKTLAVKVITMLEACNGTIDLMTGFILTDVDPKQTPFGAQKNLRPQQCNVLCNT